jgi:L-threonylcarbamoyladenylate synthase
LWLCIRRAGWSLSISLGAGWVFGAGTGDNESMQTLRLTVDPLQLLAHSAQMALDRAAEILCNGGLVALPTETVYGLGANALDEKALARIFAAKQRPAWDPVIVHIANTDMLNGLVTGVPETARKLMQAFWPGPLTLLLPRSRAVPDSVTAGRPLVGIRMPAHAVALELIRRAGVPVAAPSANLFGHISPTTADHVLRDLDGCIDAVLDAGPAAHGVESTVLDPCQSPMIVYRPGAVTIAQIRETAGPAEFFRAGGELQETPRAALPSPGVGLRHYAPKARLVLIEAPLAELGAKLATAAAGHGDARVGIMLPAEVAFAGKPASTVVYRWGRWSAPAELARTLYAGLRTLDAEGCTVILCPLPTAEGIGAAIRDRLLKAGHQVAKKKET